MNLCETTNVAWLFNVGSGHRSESCQSVGRAVGDLAGMGASIDVALIEKRVIGHRWWLMVLVILILTEYYFIYAKFCWNFTDN